LTQKESSLDPAKQTLTLVFNRRVDAETVSSSELAKQLGKLLPFKTLPRRVILGEHRPLGIILIETKDIIQDCNGLQLITKDIHEKATGGYLVEFWSFKRPCARPMIFKSSSTCFSQ